MSLARNPAIGSPIRGPESTTGATGAAVLAAALTGGNGLVRDTRSVTVNAPSAKPQKNTPMLLAGIDYSFKMAGMPGFTMSASLAASQFVRRMHPCDCVYPMCEGSGVP